MTPGCSTICLPISKDDYLGLIDEPEAFRAWLDRAFRDSPELFPDAFADGYTLKDDRTSAKLGLRLRRVRCKATAQAFTVRPSFVLPYMAGWTDDVEKGLFLRRFGVPFWALARVFGKDSIHVLVSPGSQPGTQQRGRHHRPPRRSAGGPGGRRASPEPRRR